MDTQRDRIDRELREVMHDIDLPLPHLQHGMVRQGIGPASAVVVATDCSHRREGGQLLEDAGTADVAAVHDQGAAAQEGHRLRPQGDATTWVGERAAGAMTERSFANATSVPMRAYSVRPGEA